MSVLLINDDDDDDDELHEYTTRGFLVREIRNFADVSLTLDAG